MVKKIILPNDSITVTSSHNKYMQNEISGVRLFCEDCHVDIVKNEYIVNILRSCDSYGIKDYYGYGKHLLMNNETYFKKNVTHIPLHHKEGSFIKKIYKPYSGSNLMFVSENITLKDNQVNNFYVVVPNEFDIHNLQHKEKLRSFVSIFN